MSIARRFLTGFRQTETNEPGLELNEDGTVDLVNPDGSRTALPGGSSALTYLGPFTVDFDTPGVNTTDVVLTRLGGGTVVVAVWAFQTVTWVTSTDNSLNITVDVIDDAAISQDEVLAIDAMSGSLRPTIEILDSTTTIARRRIARVPVGATDWALRAFIFVNGAGDPTAGSFDFYALAHVPT